MKLNKEKFMKTEMGGELEETIRTWDKAIDERRKATPGIGNPDQGLGFKYWDNTCRSCQDRWEKIRKIVEGLGENSYVGFAMDGILELAEDNIREDTAYSMKERAEIAQKDARKAEKENKDLKAEIEDLKKTVEKRGATISELNTELCNARAEAKANEIPEELIQEMYCMAYDKEAESIGKMERAADQMTEATIAGEDAHGFAEEYKKQKENRNRYRKVMEMLDQRERRRAGRE